MNNVIPNKTGWPLDKEKERERATAAAALASRHRRVPDSPATMTPASELAGISRATSPPAASGRGDTREAGAPRKDVRSTTRPGSKPLVEDDLDIFGTSGSSTWADQVEEETPEAVCNSSPFFFFFFFLLLTHPFWRFFCVIRRPSEHRQSRRCQSSHHHNGISRRKPGPARRISKDPSAIHPGHQLGLWFPRSPAFEAPPEATTITPPSPATTLGP